jgi:hypothetical protein
MPSVHYLSQRITAATILGIIPEFNASSNPAAESGTDLRVVE